MKKANRILSIILAIIMLLSTFSLTMCSFAADEEKSVVDSGFCGLQGDNLKWTFYSDGELVISGTGEMDWYNRSEKKKSRKLAPWTEYYDDIEIITIEDGVTSIGNNAFISDNIQYHKVNIPKSLEYFENEIFQLTMNYQIPGKYIAFCYAGSQSEWKKVECRYCTVSYNNESKQLEREYSISTYDNTIHDLGKKIYMGLYFDGEKPDDFCEIEKTTAYVSYTPREKIELYANYYVDNYNDCELIWTIDGDAKFIKGDENKMTTGNEVSIRIKSDTTVNLKVVTSSGETIVEDDIFLRSSVDTSLSFWERLENSIAGTFYMIAVIVSVYIGALGSIL